MAFVGSNTASNAMAGKNVLLYIATDGTQSSPTWTLIGGQRGDDLTQEGEEIDASHKTSGGWKVKLQGLKEWSIDLESVFIMNDTGVAALQSAFRSGTECYFKYEYANGSYQTGYGSIVNFNVKAPHDGVVTVTGKIVGSGAISEVTTPPATTTQTSNPG